MKRLALVLAFLAPVAVLAACGSTGTSSDTSAEIVTCDSCGVAKGEEGCCDPEAARCDDCGKIKGSAGCCK